MSQPRGFSTHSRGFLKVDQVTRLMSNDREPDGFCLWLTGLPSAGKTTIARELRPRFDARGYPVEILDGDELRRWLSTDLGFDRASRETQAMRAAAIAKEVTRRGGVAIVSLISPYQNSRARARAGIGRFVEVYVSTPVEECERRDVKGLYRKARAGELRGLTGVDDPYEPPDRPEICVNTAQMSPSESAIYIEDALERLGWLPAAPASLRSRTVLSPIPSTEP
jgi:adenylyl-sulfate kinase